MNVLMLTLIDYDSIYQSDIYTDLARELKKNEHKVFIISPIERRKKQDTHLIEEDDTKILKLKIGNIQKTNFIEKTISTLTIGTQFIIGIKKYFFDVKFDFVLYSTPPVTFCDTIQFLKRRDGAQTYLMLKDIFPQNAVDIGMMSKTGIKAFIYNFFRHKEKKLYAFSDHIGCMSEANVEYIAKHNKNINSEILEVFPNSIEIFERCVDKKAIREKYGLPINKKIFIYGGNLGKPQGIEFLVECLKSQKNNLDIFFLIVGDGTEYKKLEWYFNEEKPSNFKLIKTLPKTDFETIVAACDVGMIFLDYRFTIPNFPSRLLSYLQAKIPVIACTDVNTDIGKIIVDGKFGWWCESKSVEDFDRCVKEIIKNDMCEQVIKKYGLNGYIYMKEHYDVSLSYKILAKYLGE